MNNGWRPFGAGLLAGLLIGAAGANLWRGARLRHHDPHKRQERILKKFENRLGLDAEQRAAVEALLKKRHAFMRAEHEALREKSDAQRRETRAAVEALLRPEQRAAFAKMTAEWDAKRARMRKRGPPRR